MEHYISENRWCVYYHRNKINGKYYVGISKNTKQRWSSNGRQYVGSHHFWKAIQKYGWDNFDHVILIENLEKEQAKMIQIYLIAKFDLRNPDIAYNITKGGDTGNGLYGVKHPMSKPVFQYTWQGDFVKEWGTISEAAETLHIKGKKIGEAASKNRKQAHGFQWSFEKVDKMPPYTGFPGNTVKKYPKVYKVDYDGTLIQIYDDLHKIDGYTPKEYEKIRQCCCGTHISAYGFFWFFEPDYSEEAVQKLINRKFGPKKNPNRKKVCVYDMSGKLIQTFQNSDAASEYTNVLPRSIEHACNSKNIYHHMKGFLFYYDEETHGKDVEPWKNKRLRPVLRFHDGKFIEKLPYLKAAIDKYGGSVQYAVKAKTHYSYGDIWVYEDQYLALKDELCLEEIDLTNLVTRPASCTE